MTISSQTRKAGPFVGNGTTTAFPFSFKVFAASDLQVVRANSVGAETVLTLNSDYTVALNSNQTSNPGGTVTLASALATGSTMAMTSVIGYLQPTDLTNQGGFYPAVINTSLDRLTMLTQQLKEQVDRSAKLPITNDADAESLVADIIRLADSADEIDTVAGSVTSVNTVASNIAAVNNVSTNMTAVTAAVTSAANAATSATNAASSATAAASSASSASTSASTATTKASEASTSATNAASSATAAASSATSASTSASTATTKASEATTSATNAASSASAASSSATSASTSASSASASATTAEYWADLAAAAARNGAHVTDFGAAGNGTTDDTTAIQAAINSGAKLIVFPSGFTFLTDQVTSAGADTTFYAVGATIKLKPNSTIYRPLRINHARCTVIGGTWDGNKANQTAGDAFGSWAIGIHADDGAVYDATIKNFRGSGVKVVGGNRCTVERCRITDIGYSTSATCYGIYMETTGGVALYGNKARDNFIQLGNNGLADQGILFTSNSTTGGEAQWDWEISGNTVYGSTNGAQGDLAINLAARGHRGKVIGNTTTGGSMGWSEGGDQTVIQGNTFKDTVGTLRWGIEASGSQMAITGNIATGHIRAICFSFPDNDDMLIAGNTLESDGTGNHCIAAEIPAGGTGKNLTIVGNMMRGRRGIIATREIQGMNVTGNTFVGPGSGTSGSRFIFIDSPVSAALYASIKANKISACERAVSVYSASATTFTDIAFTGNNCRDDVAGGVYAHVISEGSAVLGSRVKNFDNEQNATGDNFNMLFDNMNRRGIEYSNSYATPEGNVTAGVGSIYVNLAGSAGTVLWIKESGTGNTGWKALGVSGGDATRNIGYLNVPQNSQSAAYTLVLGDSGKHILHPSADTTARTFTIPANSSVAFPVGTAITFINQNGAGTATISITTDTMRLAGAGTTGSRTLAANGVATAIKITGTEWIISGAGLT